MGPVDTRERWFVESFSRGLAVMSALGRGGAPLRLSDVAEATGIPRAAARRLLKTLEALDYVGVQDKRFYLRAKVLDLGYAYLSSINIEQAVQPYLADLANCAMGSSSVGILDAGEVIYVAQASAQNRLKLVLVIGSRHPAYAMSLGRVMLANLPQEQLERYLETIPLQPLTPYTITDPARLRDILAAERERGWSGCKDESVVGLTGIAVPIRDSAGTVKASVNLSLMGHANTPDEMAAEYLPLLRTCADNIARILRSDIIPVGV